MYLRFFYGLSKSGKVRYETEYNEFLSIILKDKFKTLKMSSRNVLLKNIFFKHVLHKANVASVMRIKIDFWMFQRQLLQTQ